LALGDSLVRRLRLIIARYGETIRLTYNNGGSFADFSGRVALMNQSQRYAYFRSTETSTWALPAYVITYAGDFNTPVSPNTTTDTLTVRGVVLKIRKIQKPRLGNVTVTTIIFAAATA